MLAAIIVILTVALDQLSKTLVVSTMEFHGESIEVLGKLLVFYRTENDGAAFGMLSNARWVFIVFSLLAIAAGVFYLIKYNRRHVLLTISVSMLLGGGIGNMIDRLFRAGIECERAVVDFLHSSLMPWFYFNLADAFITVGAVLLCVYMLFIEPKVEKKLAAQKASEELAEQEEKELQESE
ncbi:MAG: signal peptidase II [Clostridia bacterium]|nr:signal peptidase II [Clostridia bacterium]